MGEHGVGENVTTCYEDGKIIENNVGEPEVTESELSLSSDDNAPRLDQDVAPLSQEDLPNVQQPRKNKARFALGECNSDPAQGEESRTAFSKPKTGRRTLSRRGTIPHNYEMVPPTADSARPLLSFIEDEMRTLIEDVFEGEMSMGDEMSPNWALLGSSANEDAYRGRIRSPRMVRPLGEDEHLNYGRAPLIRDLYSDSVRPLPSVNEDTYGGGGGVRMSPFTTTHNYGTQQLCCAQQGQPMSSPTLIKNNSYAHSDRPLSSANEDAYSGGIRMRRDVTTRNYGKVPLTSDNFADASARPLPPVNEEAYGGGGGVRMSPFTMRKDLGFLTSGFGRILCNRLLYFTVIVSIFCCLICRIVATLIE